MPVSNFKGLQRMADPCGIPLPAWLAGLFEGLDDDPETRRLIACSVAAETCAKLAEEGFSDFPLLHPEPGGPGLCHLPGAGRPRGRAAPREAAA